MVSSLRLVLLISVVLATSCLTLGAPLDQLLGNKLNKNFAKSLDKPQRQAYKAIINDKQLTIRELNRRIDEFVATLSPQHQKKYAEIKKDRVQRLEAMRARIEVLNPTLSDKTRRYITEVGEVLSDDSITSGEQQKRLKDLQKSKDLDRKEVRRLLKALKGAEKAAIREGKKNGKGKGKKSTLPPSLTPTIVAAAAKKATKEPVPPTINTGDFQPSAVHVAI